MYKYSDKDGIAAVVNSNGEVQKTYGEADGNTRLIGEAYARSLNAKAPKAQTVRPSAQPTAEPDRTD